MFSFYTIVSITPIRNSGNASLLSTKCSEVKGDGCVSHTYSGGEVFLVNEDAKYETMNDADFEFMTRQYLVVDFRIRSL